MRALLLLLALIAAPEAALALSFKMPPKEVPICYYRNNKRDGVVIEMRRVQCLDLHQAKFSDGTLYDFKCGVTNTFSLFGDTCNNPCHAALRGVLNYAAQGKTVVYGPPLALAGPGGFVAFNIFEGSCDALRNRVQSRQASGLEQLRDDAIIANATTAVK